MQERSPEAHIVVQDLTMAYSISSRLLDDLILALRDGLGATVVIVTHELASIFAIGTNSVFLDAGTRTMIAHGPPKTLLAESDDPTVRRFLRRGETGT